MKIGKRLYYLKETGDVIFDTGEIDGDVTIKPTIEQDIILGGLTSLKEDEYGVMELEYGEYKQEFIEKDCCKINTDTDEIYFVNRKYKIIAYKPIFGIPLYSKEKILEFYNEHYLFNVRNLARVQDQLKIGYQWLPLNDIRIKPTILSKTWDFYFEDKYLKNCIEDKANLAKEIIKNGTFWPIVCQRMDDGGFMSAEGTHRVISLQLLELYEGLPDFKLLSLIIEDRYENYKHNSTSDLLEVPIRQRIPYVCKFDHFEKDSIATEKSMRNNGYTFVDDEREIIEFTARTYTDLVYANQILPHWLRDIFFEARELYGLNMKGATIINNEKEWEKMKNAITHTES